MSGAVYDAGLAAAFGALMLGVAVSDWRRYRVPDPLVAAALALRAFDLFVMPAEPPLPALAAAAARALVMSGLFYLFRLAYRRWRGREGMGLGDVKLAAVAGAWVDWPWLPAVVQVAALSGLALAILRAARRGQKLGATTRLPFAVGFSGAIFVGWQAQRFYL